MRLYEILFTNIIKVSLEESGGSFFDEGSNNERAVTLTNSREWYYDLCLIIIRIIYIYIIICIYINTNRLS